jgi:predicted tellurium resistance membrane protein TerC
MGIVATQAPFLFHCRMDTRAFRGFIVALITKGAALFHQNQLIGITVLIVTRFAIRFLDRGMNYLLSGILLRPLSMAFTAFGSRGRRCRQQGYQRPAHKR